VDPAPGDGGVSFLGDVWTWFNDPLNWRGAEGVPVRMWEHLQLSLGSLLLACLLAVPAGLAVGRSRRKGTLALNLANIGRAIPSFAVISLGVIWIGIGWEPALLALVLLGVPPIFTLTFSAVREVDPAVVDAARGMGMRERRLLRDVQVPLALPLVLDGIRLSAAAILATATLAALVGWGGLGRYITHGFAVRDYAEVFAGVVLVAAMVVVSEAAFTALTRLTVSPGLLRTRRRALP
jgi:osmoprotectant transport system permease protein